MTQMLGSPLSPLNPPPTGAWVFCPTCGATLGVADGEMRCPDCNWLGEAYAFSPKHKATDVAEAALPDDAACLHHPSKRATAVCAGTGDYICALCTIELKGQTYSADYLNNGGNEIARQAFTAALPRPDGRIYLYFALLVLLPITGAFAFLWVPHAFMLHAQARRMRREDPLFRRLMGPTSIVIIPILLTLVSIAWVIGLFYVVQAIRT